MKLQVVGKFVCKFVCKFVSLSVSLCLSLSICLMWVHSSVSARNFGFRILKFTAVLFYIFCFVTLQTDHWLSCYPLSRVKIDLHGVHLV